MFNIIKDIFYEIGFAPPVLRVPPVGPLISSDGSKPPNASNCTPLMLGSHMAGLSLHRGRFFAPYKNSAKAV